MSGECNERVGMGGAGCYRARQRPDHWKTMATTSILHALGF